MIGVIPVAAFCGFFVSGADARLDNNASQVVLLRKGSHTVMTMSNNYKGPPRDFAMVVPVPVVLKKKQVKTLKPGVFAHIDQLSAPRLVEYWEQDPCHPHPAYGPRRAKKGKADGAMDDKARSDPELGVKIEAQFTVGEYEILILSAQESTGLETWLRRNEYRIPEGAAAALGPYVRDQMKFFVARVDITKVKRDAHDLVVLSPLQFSYTASELRLPVRLGLLNAPQGGQQDLIIYVLHPTHRLELANYKNVFIPSNVEVADAVRQGFGAFYAALFDETLRRNDNRAVVTEYAWDTASCDPCPTPPLDERDLLTLGAGDAAADSWVLTRLHTRYDRQALSEDLIFRKARAVTGGRANWDGTALDKVDAVKNDEMNNFQGRYIIRHYWDGQAACKRPRYGLWGGPPAAGHAAAGQAPEQRLKVAEDLANAPREKLQLGPLVRSRVPSLGMQRGADLPLRLDKGR